MNEKHPLDLSLPEGLGADEQAAELDAIRRRVINVVGHELRTPVTTILGLVESLESTVEEGERAEVVAALGRNVRRLDGLLQDLLVAAGLPTVLPVGPRQPVEALAMARRVWEGLAGEPLAVRGTASATVLTHPESLEAALERIFDNAIRYGTRPPEVTASHDADRVRLAISSPGVTPHPEELRLGLEAFFRGEHAVTTAPGLGLGLTVARALVVHGGGRVWLEEAEGGGVRTVLDLEAAGQQDA